VRDEELHRLAVVVNERQALVMRIGQIQATLLDRDRRGPDESTVAHADLDRLARDHEARLWKLVELASSDARVVSIKRRAVAEALQAAHATQCALDTYGAVLPPASRVDLLSGGKE
jgi:hypothetical protein